MTLNEAMVEEAALGWFQELGYTVLPGPMAASPATMCAWSTSQPLPPTTGWW